MNPSKVNLAALRWLRKCEVHHLDLPMAACFFLTESAKRRPLGFYKLADLLLVPGFG